MKSQRSDFHQCSVFSEMAVVRWKPLGTMSRKVQTDCIEELQYLKAPHAESFSGCWYFRVSPGLESAPCSRMSALSWKPSLRHSVSEWLSNNQQLAATAQHERHVSQQVRQEGRTLRNKTHCKVGRPGWVRTAENIWGDSAHFKHLAYS